MIFTGTSSIKGSSCATLVMRVYRQSPCFCSPPCKDLVWIYKGYRIDNLRKVVCRSTGEFGVTFEDRIARVLFTTDAIQGLGKGFTGNFVSYGMSVILETVVY